MARRSSQAVDWAILFREWRASSLTQPEFCRRRGLSLHTFLQGTADHDGARQTTADAVDQE